MRWSLLLALCCALMAAEPDCPRARVPADGRLLLADPGLRDWGAEPVRWAIDPAQAQGRTLRGPEGAPVPFQVADGVLTFVARVARGATAAYALVPGPAATAGVQVERAEGAVVLANDTLALRLPVGEASGRDLPAAEAPVPIDGWRVGGRWIGGMRWAGARRVAGWSCALEEQGPAVATWRGVWRFHPHGSYACRVRVAHGVRAAVIEEEADLGAGAGAGEDGGWLLLDLHRGWDAPTLGDFTSASEQQVPAVASASRAAVVAKAAQQPAPPAGDPAPRIDPPLPGMVRLFALVAGGRWGGYKGAVQVGEGDLRQPAPGADVAFAPLHPGSWRRGMSCPVWHQDGTGVVVGLPLAVRPLTWATDPADDISPFSTHEHDPELPATYLRRVWGLSTGLDLVALRAGLGHIGLDRFKDWILDWPDRAGPAAYPGAWFRADLVERQKRALDGHPEAAALRQAYLISGDPAQAEAAARRVLAFLRQPYKENDFFLVGLSNYRKSQLLFPALEAEDALACPQLDPALRRELRAWLALYAHVLSEPDLNPRGAGLHLGNNNMPINRTLAFGYFAALLPDHPRHAWWMQHLAAYTRFKLATYISPAGEAFEPPTYQLYAPAGALNVAHNLLRNRGIADLAAEDGGLVRSLRYLADLTVLDQRFPGRRVLPGMGNSQNHLSGVWGTALATCADRPAEASWLAGMFRAAGGVFEPSNTVHACLHPRLFLSDQPPAPPALASRFLPAYGVAFRDGEGAGEVSLHLRAGVNWGHWDTDFGNLLLYARGVPLSPGTGYQYYYGLGYKDNAVYHNRCKPVRRDLAEPFGRVDSAVLDRNLGGAVEYAVAERRYPRDLFPGTALAQDGARWRRHVAFLRGGPGAYAVVRDTFPGAEDQPKWWTWLNLDGPERIAVEGRPFPALVPEKPVPEADMPAATGQAVDCATAFGAGTRLWFARPTAFRVPHVLQYGAPGLPGGKEVKTKLEAAAGPGEDFHYLVWPHPDGAPLPACSRPAPGVLAVVHPAGRDWVLLADEPAPWSGDGVELAGRGAAVRVEADRVVLSVLAGPGRAGWRGLVLASDGPCERVVPLAGLRPGALAGTPAVPAMQRVALADGVEVRGEGPFTAERDGEAVVIRCDGRERLLHLLPPPGLRRPWYAIDGRAAMASWTDPPSSGWGTWQDARLVALPVPAGAHELRVSEWRFPPVWPRQFTPGVRP